MYKSYEIIINGKKYKNLDKITCNSNDLLSNIRNNNFKKFNNLVFLNGRYIIPKDQENFFKVNEILNNNKLYLKSSNNEYNNINFIAKGRGEVWKWGLDWEIFT